MIKRPLCLAAVLFLGIQAFLAGVCGIAKDLRTSPIENSASDGAAVVLSGVVSRREERPAWQIYFLTDVRIRLDDQIIEESNILVYFKQDTAQSSSPVQTGHRIRAEGTLSFFEESRNPGNFNRRFYYQKQGIHALVWADSLTVSGESEWPVRESLTRLRICWKRLLTEKLGAYYGNCMSAILLGDKSELDEDAKTLYQTSGIGHILAISGLHMSFLGSGIYRLLRRSGFSFVYAGLAGILFLALYTMMIGSGVSSQRALVMFVIRIGADMSGRDYDLPTSLAAAAAVIVWLQPLYVFDAGFLLSFGALSGIAWILPIMQKKRLFPAVLRASISIQLVLLPILLYHYFEIPLYSLFLNLLVIPLMSVVLGAGVFGSALILFCESAGSAVLSLCRAVLWLYEKTAQLTLDLPGGRLVLGQPRKWWCVLYYVVLITGCVLVMRKNDKCNSGQSRLPVVMESSVVLFGLLFCIGCAYGHDLPGTLRVTAIDVGQGDSLYVRTPAGNHYLIDGGSTSESRVGKYRMEPFLKSQGVGCLDYVFVSHGDTDHINGIEELLQNQERGIRIERLVLPTEHVLDPSLERLAVLAEENGTRVLTMKQGQQITDGSCELTCLAPSDDYQGENGNDASMVLKLVYQDFSMLFTGDLEAEGEASLIAERRLSKCCVLKAGHHGSNTSTSEEMLAAASPVITLISAGKENPYGHPHKETLERLRRAGSRVYSTQECGAITLSTNGKTMGIVRYLQR